MPDIANTPGQSPTVPGTPATPQPTDPGEGGSKGVENPATPKGVPQKDPDPGIEQQPHKAPAIEAPAVREKAGDPQSPPKKEEPAAAGAAPAAPATYDLKLPANADVDATVVERTAAFAKERGLSQEQAQSTLELVAAEVATRVEADDAKFKAQVAEWAKQTDSDVVLGKNREERRAAVSKGRAVIDKFAEARPDDAKALRGFLDDTGFREHPAVVRFFAWLGKSAGESPFVAPGSPEAKPRSAAQLLYENEGRGPVKEPAGV